MKVVVGDDIGGDASETSPDAGEIVRASTRAGSGRLPARAVVLIGALVLLAFAARSPGVLLVAAGLIAVVLGGSRRARRLASDLLAVGVNADVVRLAHPYGSLRRRRAVGTTLAILGAALVGIVGYGVAAPTVGIRVGGWTSGFGLTSEGRRGIVWYDDATDLASERRDHPPWDAVLGLAEIPLLLLWIGVFLRSRAILTSGDVRDATTLRSLLADDQLAPAAQPFVAAELVLAEPAAFDAVDVARTVHPGNGDRFLRGWTLALAHLGAGNLAAGKETLASTFAVTDDGRRILVANALASVWRAAGDEAMAAAYHTRVRRLARRAGYRVSLQPITVEASDATLVTGELDRDVSKNPRP